MKITPYITFSGQCEEAFKLYEQVLGGKILMTHRYSEMPGDNPMGADMKNWVMHTRLQVGDATIYGSDTPAERYRKPAGTQVSIDVADPAEAERIFAGLSEGANVIMPIQETFWALRFGMLTDKFGTPWMVNCEKSM